METSSYLQIHPKPKDTMAFNEVQNIIYYNTLDEIWSMNMHHCYFKGYVYIYIYILF